MHSHKSKWTSKTSTRSWGLKLEGGKLGVDLIKADCFCMKISNKTSLCCPNTAWALSCKVIEYQTILTPLSYSHHLQIAPQLGVVLVSISFLIQRFRLAWVFTVLVYALPTTTSSCRQLLVCVQLPCFIAVMNHLSLERSGTS